MNSSSIWDALPWRRRKQLRQLSRSALVYLILGLLSILFLIPFFWMISTSFKPPRLIYVDPPVWIPDPITLDNFINGWKQLNWAQFYQNSAIITVLSVIGGLISSSIVGFAFASLNGRGKNFLFALLLATLMVPAVVTLIPTFIMFSKVGWVNTFLPLIVPQWFANPFYVFMFRQFFLTIPHELYDSAELDGCTPFDLYWRIAVPLSGPVFATAALFAFLGAWNDFQAPLIYISELKKYTLTLGLAMFQGLFGTQLQYMMPMALLAMIPILVLFFLAQKYFVRGIATTGMKM
ncbi:MAG TPA: carbohydrate ABC transporter permease [Anaerolineae bacterium]|nr:carbohydrate ABC transporter permease [Anaerolineae bacterium]